MSNRRIFGMVVVGICAVVLLIVCLITVRITNVGGTELGVKETWSGGVEQIPYPPKTYFLIPGFSQKIYCYDMSTQVFTMNDTPTKHEPSYKGREVDAYLVNSSEGQEMVISLNVRWHRDPDKIVNIHTKFRENIEEKLIRPTVMLVVKNEATMRKAIDAFSGEGLVKLQQDVQKDLMSKDGELARSGVVVESFVIEKIKLDDKYIGEIRSRQVASQQKLRADEETKASQAMALKAQADAMADYNKREVEAKRDKAVGILKAEELAQKQILDAKAAAERVTLAAEADKKQVVLAAEGEMEAGVNKAKAIQAIGEAVANATKMKLSAYAVPGADAFVKIEVAKHMATSFSGIKGYLPADLKVNLLTSSFMKSLDELMGKPKDVPVTK